MEYPVELSSRDSDAFWYVLRVTYQRELSAKSCLDKEGITNFVPMRKVRRRNAQGRFCWTSEVAVHNYVFVRTDRVTIQRLKTERLPYIRYVMNTADGVSRILTVPDSQMRSFIAVAGNTDEQVLFLEPSEVDLSRGDRVRIVDGVFQGVEGVFMRVRNARDRRVVVKIEGVTAVATAVIPASLVEKIE